MTRCVPKRITNETKFFFQNSSKGSCGMRHIPPRIDLRSGIDSPRSFPQYHPIEPSAERWTFRGLRGTRNSRQRLLVLCRQEGKDPAAGIGRAQEKTRGGKEKEERANEERTGEERASEKGLKRFILFCVQSVIY